MRLAGLLRDTLRDKGVSIRSLEQKMGVGNSVYQKALKGRIVMTVDTLLQIVDALELDWLEFFRMAYPELQPSEKPTDEDFDHKVLDVLRRHGLLSEQSAPER